MPKPCLFVKAILRKRESQIPVPQTPSVFHPHAQRNAFRRRDARHGADLGYIPILVTDACGAGNEDAAKRSIESLKFAGDALIMDTETVSGDLRRQRGVGST